MRRPSRALRSALAPALILIAALAGAPGAQALPDPAGSQPLPRFPADSVVARALAGLDARATPRDYIAEVRAGFTAENRDYSGTRTVLALVSPLYDILIALVILFSGLAVTMRRVAHGLGQRLYVRVLVFLILYVAADFVLGFPLSVYRGFALEHQYGLSTQSLGDWIAEQGKQAVVGVATLGILPILWLAYRAVRRWPRGWWLPVAAGTVPLIVAGALLQPLVIDPLYNRFTRLGDPRLEARILELAARADIPGRDVYQVDKSSQTRKYNAYVSGFGPSQRIVLWDTMLKGMAEDEILFVMGHEMGHYRLGHIWKGIGLFSALSFGFFFVVSRIAGWATARFGELWGFTEVGDVASMPLLAATLTVVALLTQPAVNGFSRAIEHEADVFAVEVTRDNDAGARAFLKLGSQNRADPEPAPFVKLFLYTHPPLIERIAFALEYRPWREGRANRRFHGPAPAP